MLFGSTLSPPSCCRFFSTESASMRATYLQPRRSNLVEMGRSSRPPSRLVSPVVTVVDWLADRIAPTADMQT